jgi:hypothetical protein
MWGKFRQDNRLCEQYRDVMEDISPDVDRATANAALRNSLTEDLAEHARNCDACEEAAETFWAARDLLATTLDVAREQHEAAKPWFAAQVMAKIAERETEGRKALTEWSGAVAKLASRLAWVSALVLLVGTTWFYGPNGGHLNAPSVQSKAEGTPPYLFESAAGQGTVDDALVSPPER